MKKYLFLLLAFAAVSCFPDDDVKPAEFEYVGIRTVGVAASTTEDGGATVNIPVHFGGSIENPASFTVNYTVTGGTYGTDYTIVNGTSATGTVTIPAGKTGIETIGLIGIKAVPNLVKQPNVVLTITIDEASTG